MEKPKKGEKKTDKSKQTILGLKKLIFNGMAVDYSLMSEKIAYKAFEDAGVVAPRSTHAKIYVNGRYDGVYSWVENVDDVFTKDRFKDDKNEGKGALYKEAWFNSDSKGYFKDRREDGENEDSFMVEIARAIDRADVDDAADVLYKYFDMDSFVNVTAMNNILGAICSPPFD